MLLRGPTMSKSGHGFGDLPFMSRVGRGGCGFGGLTMSRVGRRGCGLGGLTMSRVGRRGCGFGGTYHGQSEHGPLVGCACIGASP